MAAKLTHHDVDWSEVRKTVPKHLLRFRCQRCKAVHERESDAIGCCGLGIPVAPVDAYTETPLRGGDMTIFEKFEHVDKLNGGD